ncbi:MAG: ATP-binding protein [Bacteroidota bacterium]
MINGYLMYFKSLYWVLIFTLSAACLPAQNTIDSLQNLVDKATDDLTRVKQTHALAEALMDSEPDRALLLLQQIYPMAESLNDPVLAEIAYSIANAYDVRQQLDSSLIAHANTIQQAERFNNSTLIIESLIDQSFIYNRKNELDKGLALAKKAYRLAKAAKNEDRILMRACTNIGRTYSFRAQFDSSNIFLHEALVILKDKLKDKRLTAETYVNMGNNEGRARRIESALVSYNNALDIMEALKDSTGMASCYRSIGTAYFFSGRFPETIAVFHQAVDVLRPTTYYKDLIVSLDFLGEAYMTIEDYENAQLYWTEAIETSKLANNNELNPELLFKKGRVLLLQEKYEEALRTLTQSKEIKETAGQHVNGEWFWYIGQANEMLNNDEAASENYRTAIERSPVVKSQSTMAKSYLGLGKISEKNRQNDEALAHYSQAYEIATNNLLRENEMDAAKGLYRLYKQRGNDKSALRYLEVSKAIQDSLFNEKNTRDIARMQADMDFEQERQEMAYAQEQELKQQQDIRRTLWGALAVAALLLFIGFLYYRSKQKANEELSRLNEKILQQKEQLEELDQAKSRFFTNISHEFRTPLTIIKGMIGRIREQPEVHLEKGTRMIQRNTVSLLNLVNQILDLRKLEANELKLQLMQGDIIQYMRFVTESHSSYAEQHGIQLHFLSASSSFTMDYDEDKILRMLSNLLSNAIKFTPNGGDIYLRISPEERSEKEFLNIEVKDTGVGIAKDNLNSIFDRFYQEDDSSTRSGEGTGIGLALTKELVKLMRGEITVTSELSKGSTFTITLPVTRSAQVENERSAPAPIELAEDKAAVGSLESALAIRPEAEEGKPKLLVVEDNEDVQQYLIAALADYYSIDTAENGAIGIDRAIAEIPDLIISDVMMPEKDGYELTDTLKKDERTDHIPIILLTAKSDTDSKISGLEKGADAYLAKPFEERELLVRIDKLLELRKKLQERYAGASPSSLDQPQVIEDPFLQKLYDYIEKHLSDASLNMNQISRALGMSRTQVFRKLKALTGKSATVLIRTIRLEKGKQLLNTSDLTISEVAFEVGFTSLSYFSTAFLEEFGVRPSSIRN